MLVELQLSSLCSELQFNLTALFGHGWQLFSKAQVSATGLFSRLPTSALDSGRSLFSSDSLFGPVPALPCSAPSIIPPVNMGQRILLLGVSGRAQWREANRSSKTMLREIKLLTIFHSIGKGRRRTSQQSWEK